MNIIGKKYRMLTVIKKAEPFILPSGQKNSAVLCRCDCGNEKVCRTLHLIRNKIPSCGCAKTYKGEIRKTGDNRAIRKLWRSLKYRCGKKYIDKHIYFDRGISVCKEWANSYHAFEKWCYENGYSKELQIDRKDNELGYSPENCRFVTATVNGRNKRNAIIVEYKGEKIHLRDLIERDFKTLKFPTVYARMKNGWSLEEAIETPKVRYGHNRFGQSTKQPIYKYKDIS